MKLKFDPSLDYQHDAIDSVVSVFDGQPIAQMDFELSHSSASAGLLQSELGVGNDVSLPADEILENVHKIQSANDIEKVPALQGLEFSLEMETGTGKTYVYLRTIFELNKNYGFRKFVIVVPSVAIREGVLKSIQITKEHFQNLYENVPFDYFVYDSKRLGHVRQFASSNQIQIMIINIQSFQKDVADKPLSGMTADELKKLNIINRENERMSGRRPIEFIQSSNPIVIIDEPQSVDNTPKAKNAIGNLNPAFTLRYSATHKDTYNLLYRLDPVRAYDLRLVKRIEVASIRSDEAFNEAYVKLLKTDNTRGIKAQLQIHKQGQSGPKLTKLWVKQGDDLFDKSLGRENYRDGYIVQNIDCTPDAEYVEFSSGRFLELDQELGGFGDEIMKAQVWETVEQHLKKERALRGKGIKVLSLFFIDKVANYRVYGDNDETSLGKIGLWFEEAFEELTKRPLYEGLIPFDVSKVHNGYFSRDKQGHVKDTSGKTKADEDTYNLIMRDKERLLDTDEPLRFIFSHSALREGWDSPNVFQICTLNETNTLDKKRQEIGRGLRLPVNQLGERVRDETVNRLTIIANESYEEFARALQTEFEEDFDIHFGVVEQIAFARLMRIGEDGSAYEIGQEISKEIWADLVANGYLDEDGRILDRFDPKNPQFVLNISEEFADLRPDVVDEVKKKVFENRVVNTRERRKLKFRKEVYLSEGFKALWDKIKQRTRYRVEFDTDELIEAAVSRLQDLPEITPIRISMSRRDVEISAAGVAADRELETRVREVKSVNVLPDIVAYLQKETELTRHTIVRILQASGRLSEFKRNPQAFMAAVAREISKALHEIMISGIRYEELEGKQWEMTRISDEAEDGIVRYLSNLYHVQNADKALFDAIEFESEVERQFAADLDNNENVKLFVKLPAWFKIDTPVGPYNPDWAFVTEREAKLFFVRETKSSLNSEERRLKENQKIACGHEHFKSIGVDFDVVSSLSDVGF